MRGCAAKDKQSRTAGKVGKVRAASKGTAPHRQGEDGGRRPPLPAAWSKAGLPFPDQAEEEDPRPVQFVGWGGPPQGWRAG